MAPAVIEPLDAEAEVWNALVLGLRDYVVKSGFSSVVIALSGGIDSAVVGGVGRRRNRWRERLRGVDAVGVLIGTFEGRRR